MSDRTPPALVGRERELNALRAAWEAGASMTIVEGPAGIGKSRLVRELISTARAHGAMVMIGRCSASSLDTPLRPLREALLGAARAGVRPPDEMRSFVPALARLVPEWAVGDMTSADSSPLILGEALLRLMTWHAQKAPALLVIEDIQWADAESVAVLEYLADNLAETRTSVVATLRTGEAPNQTPQQTTRLVLRPLDPSEVLTMAAAITDGDLPPDIAPILQARSEGVPFLVEELLAAAQPAGWSTIAEALPGSVTKAVEVRLTDLPPDGADLLLRAATLGRHFDWIVAAHAASITQPLAAELLRAAVRAQLVDVDGPGFRFHHALTRDAVLALANPAELRIAALDSLHAIDSLHTNINADQYEIVANIATMAGDNERAAELWLTAAQHALEEGGLASAESLANRVERTRTADRDLLLLRISALSGQSERASKLATALLDAITDAAPRAEIHILAARAALVAGHWTTAEEHAEAARSLVPNDPTVTARTASVAALAAMGRDDAAAAIPLAQRALDEGRATNQPDVQCEALEVIGRAERGRDLRVGEAAFEQALKIATEAKLPVWRLRALQELGTIDLFETLAAERLEEAKRTADATGALAISALIDLQLAALYDERAELHLALAAARRCEEASRRWGLATLPMSLAIQAMAHARLDNEAEMRAAAEAAIATGQDAANVEIGLWGNVYPIWHLVRGDLASAGSALDHAMEVQRALPGAAFPVAGLWALVRTILDSDGAAARDETRAMPVDTPVSRAMLTAADSVAAGHQGDSDAATSLFATAQEALDRMQGGFRKALVQLVVAPDAHANGWGDPLLWLRESLAVFERADLTALAARAREALRQLGAPVPRKGRGEAAAVPPSLAALGITSREADVLALVAAGYSNRMVAEELVISPRTVDKHVERLLLKAQTTRAGLADLAEQAGLLRT